MKDEEKRKKENTASDLTQLKAPRGTNGILASGKSFEFPPLDDWIGNFYFSLN